MKTLLTISFLSLFSVLLINCDSETTNLTNIVYDTVEIGTIDTVLMVVWDSMYTVNSSNDTTTYIIISEIDYKNNCIDYYILGGKDTSQSYIIGGYYLFDQNHNIISNVTDFYYWEQPENPHVVMNYTYNSNKIVKITHTIFSSNDTATYLVYDSLRNPIRERHFAYSNSTQQIDSIIKDVYYSYIFNSNNQLTSQITHDSNNIAFDTLNFSYSNDLPSEYNFDGSYIKREPAIQSFRTGIRDAFQVLKYHSNGMIAEDHQFDSTGKLNEILMYSEEGYLVGGVLHAPDGSHNYTQYKTLKKIPYIIY